ncbi:aldolase [Methylobacterium sp. Leaf118]|uniref:aldolase n=1 Tax=Methylobacterium sp. Leaf118 TaxID=2876562 RepID=UPI001E647B6C|nr:aldolase [Methylobacterium sp. Leaf118]
MFAVPCPPRPVPPRLAVALCADALAPLAAGLPGGAEALVLAGPPPADIRARIGAAALIVALEGPADPLPLVAPDALLLRDARSGRDVVDLGARLAVHEAEQGWPDGGVPILAEIAHPLGLLDIRTFVGASPRLVGLGLDGAALAASMGAEVSASRHARGLVRLAAAAAGVTAFARAGPEGARRAMDRARREGIGLVIVQDPGEATARPGVL